MSADNYLFVDRKTFRVYNRFLSNVYGGFSDEAIHDDKPQYTGKNYNDALSWAYRFEPNEYGIFTGTLCSGCGAEVEEERESYPLCRWCDMFAKAKAGLGEKETIITDLEKEVRPFLP